MVETWPWAFAATIVLETPIIALAVKRQLGVPRALGLAVLLQVLTHPVLWFVLPRFQPYWAWVLAAESLVVVAEAIALTVALRWTPMPWRQAAVRGLAISMLANVFSTAIGRLIS